MDPLLLISSLDTCDITDLNVITLKNRKRQSFLFHFAACYSFLVSFWPLQTSMTGINELQKCFSNITKSVNLQCQVMMTC